MASHARAVAEEDQVDHFKRVYAIIEDMSTQTTLGSASIMVASIVVITPRKGT